MGDGSKGKWAGLDPVFRMPVRLSNERKGLLKKESLERTRIGRVKLYK